jgi:serine/threonine-protein kinase
MIRPDARLSGRYRLQRRIAVGGMGEVWLATDEVLDRAVAVKLLHQADEYQYADAVARFRAEAKHVGSLSHPGIAQVYDYGEADRDHPPFLVMELVDGPPLTGLLSQGPLDPTRTMNIVAQTADALHAAHAAGLVHRDIKPGNLLIGRGDRVKIIDFGIAQAATSVAVTGTGAVIGSPAYLAPERVRGGAATPASDLYSLGIVAYECLAGAPPFSGTSMAVAHAHVHQPMPPLPPAIPAEIAALVGQLTAKNPAARPASAADVAARARRLRDSQRGNRTMVLPVMQSGSERYDSPGDRDYAGGSGKHRVLADIPPAGDPSRPGHAARGRTPRRFGLVAPMIAVALVVLAGLIGWQLNSVLGAGQSHQAANTPPASAPPSTQSSSPAANTVMVNANTLNGQNVQDVQDALRQLGLQPKLVWQQPTGQQQPGTVISVTPSGPVQPGAVITVTVAGWCGGGGGGGDGGGDGGGGCGHGNGHGNGGGGGN